MEIFNPSEWKQLKNIDADKAQSEIDHIRERGSVKSFFQGKQIPKQII